MDIGMDCGTETGEMLLLIPTESLKLTSERLAVRARTVIESVTKLSKFI